jgi:hypothetical protein
LPSLPTTERSQLPYRSALQQQLEYQTRIDALGLAELFAVVL